MAKSMHLVRRAAFCLAAFWLGVSCVWAHAVLKRAVPDAGSIIAGPAITFLLQFNTRVDSKRSRLSLVTPDGKTMSLDIGPQPTPDALVAPAKGLLTGEYKLRWQVLASDGHITRGQYSFRVR